MISMQHLLVFLKQYRWEFFLGSLCKLLEAIFELFVPLLMANIIDKGIGSGDPEYIIHLSLCIVLLGIFGLIFALVCQYLAARCAFGFGKDLREHVYHHLYALSAKERTLLGTSRLINTITNDVTLVQTGVNMCIRQAVRAPFLVIGAIVMSIIVNARLSLFFFLLAPILAMLLYHVSSRTIPMYRHTQKKLDCIARHTEENLDGVRVIRAFCKQDEELSSFTKENEDLERHMLRVGRISALLSPGTFLCMNLGIAAVLWFGGNYIDIGIGTQGELTALTSYMTQILLSMVMAASLLVTLMKAQASANRIHEVLSLKPSMIEGTLICEDNEIAISITNVSFSYTDSGEPALHDISFSLKTGKTLGIIGGTGSGKSTLLSLLTREYDPTQGEVTLFGRNVRDYSAKELSAILGLVPQRTVLFSGTIAQNLRIGNPSLSDEELWNALDIAQVSDFVKELPYGLDTHLVQGGRNLSGGQRQRLTIARALAKSPKILLLDDSMSALDYATDSALRQALAQRCRSMTKVIVSQRASTLRGADCIVVLEDGVIVGCGKHDDLLKDCAVYRDIYTTQNT